MNGPGTQSDIAARSSFDRLRTNGIWLGGESSYCSIRVKNFPIAAISSQHTLCSMS
jgi:hypothetical protein